MAGRYYRNGLFDWINMSKCARQLTDTRQARLKNLFSKVIELELYVIAVRTATTTL
jgi:hypothetical protein